MTFDWHKRNHSDMIELAIKLDHHEAFGIYNVLLDHMHMQGRPLVDDDRRMSGLLAIHPLKWRAIKRRLIDAGALFVEGGYLDSPGSLSARSTREATERERREAGKKGGMASAKTRKSKHLAEAKSKQRRGEEIRGDSCASRRTRVPGPITDKHIEFASTLGLTKAQATYEFDKFKDHHAAKGSVMADWMAAWRTWCRNSVRFADRDQKKQLPPDVEYFGGIKIQG